MNEQLQQLVEAQKRSSFTNPENASDDRALGILISKHLKWDGDAIVEVFLAAMEDANFAIEADLVRAALSAPVGV